MKKICAITGREFELRQQELDFYERMGVPVPDVHPDEILRSLMACRNEWKLYRRKCDKTGETIISAYRSDQPFPVYKDEVWWGDSWNALDYGQDYDPDRSFFEQLTGLRNAVPREGTSVFNSENCDYNGHTRECKNCYLMGLSVRCEDSYYSYWVVDNKDIVDCRMTNNSELCYECVNCDGCFDCVMAQECYNCSDCHFSYQLRGCRNCIGCNNLERKQYYIFNKPVSSEEFEAKKKAILNGSYETWQQGLSYFQTMWDSALHRYVHALNCENCEGDVLLNSKNCWYSFECVECEDCSFNVSAGSSKDVHHSHSAGWPGCELIHHSAVTRGSTDIRFCYYTWFSNALTYCDSCVSCQDCFGCIGLKHKKYCILNKQYSKEEYFALRDRIIEQMKKTPLGPPLSGGKEIMEWGRFPPEMSTFAYNETAAQDYFPLTKSEAEARGYRWLDDEICVETPCQGVSTGGDIPDSIHDVDDSICRETLICRETGRPYQIQKGELKFYKKMNLPIPRLCPEARRAARGWRIMPYQLYVRQCSETGIEVLSCFSPDRPERIGCEEAYRKSLQ